jgi:hypothetical protein
VTVEVDDVVGGGLGAVEFLLEGREGGRLEDFEFGEGAEGGEGFDDGAGADAVVEVGGGVVFRAGADEEDADGRLGGERGLLVEVGEAAADADASGALEEKAAVVVKEFPGEGEEEGGGFIGFGLFFGGGRRRRVPCRF